MRLDPHLDSKNGVRCLFELLETRLTRHHATLQYPVPGEKGVVVKNNCVELGRLDECLLQAVVNSVVRKARVVFFAGETLLLGSSDDFTVLYYGRGGVVIEGGNTENCLDHRYASCGLLRGRSSRGRFLWVSNSFSRTG